MSYKLLFSRVWLSRSLIKFIIKLNMHRMILLIWGISKSGSPRWVSYQTIQEFQKLWNDWKKCLRKWPRRCLLKLWKNMKVSLRRFLRVISLFQTGINSQRIWTRFISDAKQTRAVKTQTIFQSWPTRTPTILESQSRLLTVNKWILVIPKSYSQCSPVVSPSVMLLPPRYLARNLFNST